MSPDKYGVIGNPVTHSISPLIHQQFAKQTKQKLVYEKYFCELNKFTETVQAFQKNGGKGLNVTLPFKLQAFSLADKLSDQAKQSGAVNTLKFLDDGKIYGDNTDGPGLIQDITHNYHYSLHRKKILLIGAGGAAREIASALLKQAPSQLVITNRTAEKAHELANEFKLRGEVFGKGFAELDNGPFDLIINASSAGMTGEFPDLPLSLVGKRTWCYDIIYTKPHTPFMQWAANNQPEKLINGIGMLIEQAALSFYLWRGVYPDTAPVMDQLRVSFV